MASGGGQWLIYALGGGWGHLTRAASLARIAQHRHRIRILTNSPYAMLVAKAMPALDLAVLDPSLNAASARQQAVREIERANPECLIVDTFPRGLGGELTGLLERMAAKRVLVHRDLDPRYEAEAGLQAFVRRTYDLVLIPGEDEGGALSGLPAAVITQPWLICDPPANPRQLRGRCIVVCASGNVDELPWYGAVAACLRELHEDVNVCCVAPTCPPGCSPESWLEHWPAADLYPNADAVIGGAGYNTVHECVAYQVPLIARPWPRMYDRQWLRARRAAKRGPVTIVKAPRDAAEAAVRQFGRPSRQSAAGFQNGAREAVALIRKACSA